MEKKTSVGLLHHVKVKLLQNSVKVKLLQDTVLTTFKKFHINFQVAWDLFSQKPAQGAVGMIWQVQILLLKIHFISYGIFYYFFMKTYLGRIISLFALPCAYGFADRGSPWLLVCYYDFVLEGVLINLICQCFPHLYDLLKEHFGSEFLREFCDNTVFHKMKGRLLIIIAYPVVRGIDQLHNDARIESKFENMYAAYKQASDWNNRQEEIAKLRDKAVQEAGHPLIQQFEQAAAAGMSHGIAKALETISKKN